MSQIPECPITKLPFVDPVMDPEGNTFEKSAILEWLAIHGTSPITRSPLNSHQLVPNRAIRDMIDALKNSSSLTPAIAKTSVISSAPPLLPSDIQFTSCASDKLQFYTVSGPDKQACYPSHICCIIDTSGSMADSATVKSENGASESHGLTILDIVKHATKVIIESLQDTDMLSIVAFSSDSRVVKPASLMTAQGKESAKLALDALYPDGSTNLAAGVKHGISVSSAVGSAFFSSIFLLTDGVPSDANLDYVGAMRRQLDKEPVFGSFSTFGFGYNLDSRLLQSIAVEGEGSFNFIPDAGFVGTVFINALANSRCIYGVGASIVLNKEKATVLGNNRVSSAGEFTVVRLPPLRFGQSVTVAVESSSPIAAFITFDGINKNTIKVDSNVADQTPAHNFYHEMRIKTAEMLFQIVHKQATVFTGDRPEVVIYRERLAIDSTFSQLRTQHAALDGLAKDREGQISEALSRVDWFQRWGRHYLISLAFAHLREASNNFKDP
eukprot:Partr_v1_DN27948_c0_g1_i2_m11128 putative domain containing protein